MNPAFVCARVEPQTISNKWSNTKKHVTAVKNHAFYSNLRLQNKHVNKTMSLSKSCI